MSVIDALGLVGDVLGIVGFFKDLLPPSAEPRGAIVQIKAGLDTAHSTNLGGYINSVYGFDNFNAYLGKTDSVKIEPGDAQSVTINQKVGGVRSDYVSIANDNDATCISWVTVSQADSTPGGAWTGDIGYSCGQTWYFGNQLAGTVTTKDAQGNDQKQDYLPRCTWLDGDHTNSIISAAMKFNVSAYGEHLQDVINNKMNPCDFTTFDKDTGPIKRAPGGANTLPAKRDITSVSSSSHSQSATTPTSAVTSASKSTSASATASIATGTISSSSPASSKINMSESTTFSNKLIKSNHKQHTSKELCESKTSFGPDFIGSDGMFCDMTTKTLTPLCSTQNVDGCVDINDGDKTVVRRAVGNKRAAGVIHKTYSNITTWP